MAKKAKYDWGRSTGKYQKFETRLTFKFDVTSDAQDSVFIDTAQCLSAINRKLIRQGQVFRIKNGKFFARDADANIISVGVSALPRTWMMYNAYRKARGLWNQMNLDSISALGAGNLSKYYDFKVLFDREHFKNHILDTGATLTSNLLPVDGSGNAFSGSPADTGEWDYSYYEDSQASADRFYGHMLGTHSDASGAAEGSSGRDPPADGGSAGLVLAYQQSRGSSFTDQDISGLNQNVDADSPWAMLFGADDQSQQVLSALDDQNDAPPYPAVDYAGAIEHPEGTLVSIGCFNSADYVGRYIPTFEAPLGLIKLDCNVEGDTNDTSNIWFTFDTEIMGAM